MITFSFFSTSLLIILLPGPGAIYTISTGLTLGKRKSIIAALGCTLGIIPHLSLGIIGMFIFTVLNNKTVYVLQMLGGLYLIYLGINMIISSNKVIISSNNNGIKNYQIIVQAILINLLNPKLTLFFLSFLPQFLNMNDSDNLQKSIILGLVFMVLTFIIFAIYGQLSGIFNQFVKEQPKRIINIQRIFGMLFIAFALKLMLPF
jgi:threonine/homoserine/homoserine lactone efflux protein